MPPVTTQPVRTEAQLSDTIEHKDTVVEVTVTTPKNVVEPQSIAKKEEILPAKAETRPVQQQPSASVYPGFCIL